MLYTLTWFKNFSLLLCLLMSLMLFPDFCSAQGKSRNKATTEKYFTMHGGAYFGWGDVQAAERTINVNHINALKFGVGLMKFKENKVSQLNLEGSFFRDDFGVIYFEDVIVRGFQLSKLLLEAEYFKSVISRDQLQKNFHLGYLFNLNVARDNAIPFATNAFQRTQTCFCLGVGIKALYVFPLSDKLLLTVGSDLNLLDSGLLVDYNANPSIFINEQTSIGFSSKLLRPRLGIDIGIAF